MSTEGSSKTSSSRDGDTTSSGSGGYRGDCSSCDNTDIIMRSNMCAISGHNNRNENRNRNSNGSVQDSSVCSISLSSASERLLSGGTDAVAAVSGGRYLGCHEEGNYDRYPHNNHIPALLSSSSVLRYANKNEHEHEHGGHEYDQQHLNYVNNGMMSVNEHDKYHAHLYRSYQNMFDLCRPYYFNSVVNGMDVSNNGDADDANQRDVSSHSNLGNQIRLPSTINFPSTTNSNIATKSIERETVKNCVMHSNSINQNEHDRNYSGNTSGTTTGASLSYSTQPSSNSKSNSASNSGSGSGNENKGNRYTNANGLPSSNDGDENCMPHQQEFTLTLKRHLKQQHQLTSTLTSNQQQEKQQIPITESPLHDRKRLCIRGSAFSSGSDGSSLTVNSAEKRICFSNHLAPNELKRENSKRLGHHELQLDENNLGKITRIEDVLSLSLMPRIVVQASHPYIVVHTNAAYSRLSGIDSIYAAGKPLSQILAIGDIDRKLVTCHNETETTSNMKKSLDTFENIVSNFKNMKRTFYAYLLAIYRPKIPEGSSNKSSDRSTTQPVRMLCKMGVYPIVRDTNWAIGNRHTNSRVGDFRATSISIRSSSPSSVSSDVAVKEQKSSSSSATYPPRIQQTQILTHYCLQFERLHTSSDTLSISSGTPGKQSENSASISPPELSIEESLQDGINGNNDDNDNRMEADINEGEEARELPMAAMMIG